MPESFIDLYLVPSLECMRGMASALGKEIHMASDRRRILELALESLENKKKQLDAEIAEIARELRRGTAKQASGQSPSAASAKRRSRFSKEERIRRSQRMKAYWDNWRKKKTRQK
jgi:hypothetical protein